MTSHYVDPKRATGSQSEVPSFWYRDKYICFDGYQRFCLARDSIQLGRQWHRRKYAFVRPFLLGGSLNGASIMDLGCSAGAMGFQAYLDGFEQIHFVDHDVEYLQLVRAGLEHIGAPEPTTEQSKVQGVTSSVDILFAFAIIHWLYSCTEDYGSLDRIIEKLSSHCRKAMFVEWIGPECKDVQSFGHITHNPEVHKDAYTLENFLTALRSRFSYVRRIGRVRKGREIWLASHSPCNPNLKIQLRERVGCWVETVSARFAR